MLQKQIEEQRERDKQQQSAQTSLQGRPSSSELYEGKVIGQGLGYRLKVKKKHWKMIANNIFDRKEIVNNFHSWIF